MRPFTAVYLSDTCTGMQVRPGATPRRQPEVAADELASTRAQVAAGVLAVWLDAKARREEVWLMARFGDYAAYRTQTRRFLPVY